MNRFSLLLLCLLVPLAMFSQKKSSKIQEDTEEKETFQKFELGLNLGTYFANKYNANYYNGQPGNVNEAGWIFDPSYPNNQRYEDIKRELGASDEVILKELPSDMHYNVSLSGGLFFRLNLSPVNSIFLEVNYTKLKAEDGFTVQVDPASYLTYDNLVVCGIHGQEERINVDLGYHRKFPVYKKKMNLFFQGGVNANYVRVLKSFVTIGNLQYDLVNTYNNGNYIDYNDLMSQQAGFGFGVIAGGGIGFTFTPTIGMEAGGNLIYTQVNLQGYNNMKPSYTAYVRFLITGLLEHQSSE